MTDTLRHEVGPHRVTGISIFYRAIAGAFGGSVGTLILLLFLLLSQQIFTAAELDFSAFSPIVLLLIIMMLFISSLLSNALGCFLMTFTDPGKYQNVGKGVLQILLINIILLIFLLPVYLILNSTEYMLYIPILQFFFTAMASALVFNAVAVDRTQTLLSIYSVTLGIFIGILLISLILSQNALIAFFLLPALVWFSIGFFGGIIEYYYYQLYQRSGIDVLQTERGFIDEEHTITSSPDSVDIQS